MAIKDLKNSSCICLAASGRGRTCTQYLPGDEPVGRETEVKEALEARAFVSEKGSQHA